MFQLKDHQEKKTVHKDDNTARLEANINPNNSMNSIQVQEYSTHNVEEFIITPSNDDLAQSHTDSPDPGVITSDHHMPIGSVDMKQNDVPTDIQMPASDISVTEILISNKRNLELQVHDLQTKLSQLEHNHTLVLNNFKTCNQRLIDLENELQNVNNKYLHTTQEITVKEAQINELNGLKTTLTEENNNLLEQLEFTKSILGAKEAESDSLHSRLYNLQNQYDVIYLQLQQLTNGSPNCTPNEKAIEMEKNEAALQKIAHLEQQLSLLQKERDQMNLHYEHYVAELNDQLRSALKKNDELSKEVQNLSNRENSLIEQISDMEIRIQNYNVDKKRFEMDQNTSNIRVLQDNLKQVQVSTIKLPTYHL